MPVHMWHALVLFCHASHAWHAFDGKPRTCFGICDRTLMFRKLSDWGLTHRGLVLRRFDGILRDFVDCFSESLNPNRLTPNHFAECCGFLRNFAEFCGFLRNFADLFTEFCGITKPQSAKPQSLNSRMFIVVGPDSYFMNRCCVSCFDCMAGIALLRGSSPRLAQALAPCVHARRCANACARHARAHKCVCRRSGSPWASTWFE